MKKYYTALVGTFCVCLVASNIFEAKIFTLGSITLTGGFLVFPISYIINDILSEVYGYSRARFAIFLAFLLNLLFVLTTKLVLLLPTAPYCNAQEHLEYLFSSDLRITAASMAAFLCGSLLNAKVMTGMKARQGGKGFGWRAVISTIIGETADSIVFFPIAFYSVALKNLLTLMTTQIVLKTLYEILVLPLTYSVQRRLKEIESQEEEEK